MRYQAKSRSLRIFLGLWTVLSVIGLLIYHWDQWRRQPFDLSCAEQTDASDFGKMGYDLICH